MVVSLVMKEGIFVSGFTKVVNSSIISPSLNLMAEISVILCLYLDKPVVSISTITKLSLISNTSGFGI